MLGVNSVSRQDYGDDAEEDRNESRNSSWLGYICDFVFLRMFRRESVTAAATIIPGLAIKRTPERV